MSRTVGSTKGAKKACDLTFSKIVRARGFCEKCGNTSNLQCAHIISRRFSNTRCVAANALCLCAGCHHYFTDHPVEWGMFVVHEMSVNYGELQRLSQSTAKVDWKALLPELRERLALLENQAAS